MKNKIFFVLSTILMLNFTVFTSNVKAESKSMRKIVIFNKDIVDCNIKDTLLRKYGAVKIKELPLVNGFSVNLMSNQAESLRSETKILRVEDDVIVTAMGKNNPPVPTQPAQTTPWGITKIKANLIPKSSTSSLVNIAVLDSGIDLSHPDLKDNIKGAYNAISRKVSANDDYGHGTHVAGIIAATNNSIGVVGVAPTANLYAIKVLNSVGNGYVSDLIEGIEWSITNGMNVINMSLGVSDSPALHDAIIKANQANIILIAAAGNNPNEMVKYPAAYPEVISVVATDYNDQISTVCPKGKIDISAPGVDIYSTFKYGNYSLSTGTSMAAAHVTGVTALLLSTTSKGDLNGDGKTTFLEVKQKLQSSAKDLGTIGIDDIYGAGLLDAYKAVTE